MPYNDVTSFFKIQSKVGVCSITQLQIIQTLSGQIWYTNEDLGIEFHMRCNEGKPTSMTGHDNVRDI